MERENRRQELYIEELVRSRDHSKQVLADNEQKYKLLEKKCKDFCSAILGDEHAKKQIGGTDITGQLDVFAFMNYAYNQYREYVQSQKTLLIDLTKAIRMKDAEIEGLKDQISRYQTSGTVPAPAPKVQEEPKPVAPPPKPQKIEVLEEDFDDVIQAKVAVASPAPAPAPAHAKKEESVQNKDTAPQKPKQAPAPSATPAEKQELNQVKSMADIIKESTGPAKAQPENKKTDGMKQPEYKAHSTNLMNKFNMVSEVGWLVLEAIGKQGYTQLKDISQAVAEKKNNISIHAVNRTISNLLAQEILIRTKIQASSTGFFVYEIEKDTGYSIFKTKFNCDPVKTDKDVLESDHDNPKHGFFIEKMATALTERGFRNVTTSRKANRIPLGKDNALIPDIIGELDGKKFYFEIELANHNQEEFDKKCNKIKRATNDIYCVVPSADTLKTQERKFDSWIESKMTSNSYLSIKGVNIFLGTAKDLKTRDFEEWTYVRHIDDEFLRQRGMIE